MQTLIDGSGCLNWIFCRGDDEIKEWGAGTLDQVRFYGNKVLQASKEKDTAWYEAYLDMISTAINFIVQRNENICDWTGKADAAEAVAFFEGIAAQVMGGNFEVSSGASEAPAQATSQAAPKAAPKAASGHATEFRATVAPGVKAMKDAAATLNIAQVTKATDQFVELVERSAKVMEAQAKFKKPSGTNFLATRTQEIFGEIDKVVAKDFKAPPNHLKTVLDGLSLFYWPLTPGDDMLKD